MNIHWRIVLSQGLCFVMANSWCCTFCECGQMYNVLHPSWYYTDYFICPKNSLCSTYSSPSHICFIVVVYIGYINDFLRRFLYYLMEQYTVLYLFLWLHDNIQDNFVNNRQIQFFFFFYFLTSSLSRCVESHKV